jgi:hypothetical protein
MPFTAKYKAELVRRIKDGENPKDIAEEEDVWAFSCFYRQNISGINHNG